MPSIAMIRASQPASMTRGQDVGLSEMGKNLCCVAAQAGYLSAPNTVYSLFASPAERTIETAEMLFGRTPEVSEMLAPPSLRNPQVVLPILQELQHLNGFQLIKALSEHPDIKDLVTESISQLEQFTDEAIKTGCIAVTHDFSLYYLLKKACGQEPLERFPFLKQRPLGYLEGVHLIKNDPNPEFLRIPDNIQQMTFKV